MGFTFNLFGSTETSNITNTLNKISDDINQQCNVGSTSIQDAGDIAFDLSGIDCPVVTVAVQSMASSSVCAVTSTTETIAKNLAHQIGSTTGGAAGSIDLFGKTVSSNTADLTSIIAQAFTHECAKGETDIQEIKNATFNVSDISCDSLTVFRQKMNKRTQCLMQAFAHTVATNTALQVGENNKGFNLGSVLMMVVYLVLIIAIVGGIIAVTLILRHRRRKVRAAAAGLTKTVVKTGKAATAATAKPATIPVRTAGTTQLSRALHGSSSAVTVANAEQLASSAKKGLSTVRKAAKAASKAEGFFGKVAKFAEAAAPIAEDAAMVAVV